MLSHLKNDIKNPRFEASQNFHDKLDLVKGALSIRV